MKTTKTYSWTIKIETTTGVIRVVRFRGETCGDAITTACQEYNVANILEVHDSKRVRWM